MAAGQALNAEAAVTVAEPRWPPPIQNAGAAVVVASKRPAHGRFAPEPSTSLSTDHRGRRVGCKGAQLRER